MSLVLETNKKKYICYLRSTKKVIGLRFEMFLKAEIRWKYAESTKYF